MTRQVISRGTAANDGTGDTLRSAAGKINDNFVELYQRLGGDSNQLSSQISFSNNSIIFEGSLADDNETSLVAENPTADRSITIPNADGTIVLDTAAQTLTNKIINSPAITTPSITTAIRDTNDNEIISFSPASSAANEITIANANSGSSPSITATGSNTNVNLIIHAKGTGSALINKVALEETEQTTDGACDQTVSYIECNKASTLNITLPEGTVNGELKVFTNKGLGTTIITPANFAQGTSISLSQSDAVTVIWDGANWYITGHYGATIS